MRHFRKQKDDGDNRGAFRFLCGRLRSLKLAELVYTNIPVFPPESEFNVLKNRYLLLIF